MSDCICWPIFQTFQEFRHALWLYQMPYRTNTFWLPIFWTFFLKQVHKSSQMWHAWWTTNEQSTLTSDHSQKWRFEVGPTWPELLLKKWQEVWSRGLFLTSLLPKISRIPNDPKTWQILIFFSIVVVCVLCTASFPYNISWVHFAYCCTECS